MDVRAIVGQSFLIAKAETWLTPDQTAAKSEARAEIGWIRDRCPASAVSFLASVFPVYSSIWL